MIKIIVHQHQCSTQKMFQSVKNKQKILNNKNQIFPNLLLKAYQAQILFYIQIIIQNPINLVNFKNLIYKITITIFKFGKIESKIEINLLKNNLKIIETQIATQK